MQQSLGEDTLGEKSKGWSDIELRVWILSHGRSQVEQRDPSIGLTKEAKEQGDGETNDDRRPFQYLESKNGLYVDETHWYGGADKPRYGSTKCSYLLVPYF